MSTKFPVGNYNHSKKPHGQGEPDGLSQLHKLIQPRPSVLSKNPGPYVATVFSIEDEPKEVPIEGSEVAWYDFFTKKSIAQTRAVIPELSCVLIKPDDISKCTPSIGYMYDIFPAQKTIDDLPVPTDGSKVWVQYLDRENYQVPVLMDIFDSEQTVNVQKDSSGNPVVLQGQPATGGTPYTTSVAPVQGQFTIVTPPGTKQKKGYDYFNAPFGKDQLEKFIKQLKASGASFVIRYVGYGSMLNFSKPSKALTPTELTSLIVAGIDVGLVFERFGDEFLGVGRTTKYVRRGNQYVLETISYFSGNKKSSVKVGNTVYEYQQNTVTSLISERQQLGLTDQEVLGILNADSYQIGVVLGKMAKKGLAALGLGNVVVYMACEKIAGDATTKEELDRAVKFLQGAKSVLGKIGVYSGENVIDIAANSNAADYLWQVQVYSRVSNRSHPKANLVQVRGHTTIEGITLDNNIAITDDIGAIKTR